jgi:hypothetical protein
MRPQPIWPIWILLLGASFPRTDDGMIVGKPAMPAVIAAEDLMNLRRVPVRIFEVFIALAEADLTTDEHG